MATRVIDNKRDRLTTIMVAPLMTCSARIPVYTLIISAFIPNRTVAGFLSLPGLVMFGLYAAGIASALAVSFLTRRLFWRGQAEPFLMELPTYKLPEAGNVARNVALRGQIFISRAGRIILPLMIVVWFLSTFPSPPAGAAGPAIDYSFAGMLGHWLQPLLAPIGFNWQMTVALIRVSPRGKSRSPPWARSTPSATPTPRRARSPRPCHSTGRSPRGCRSWPGTSSRRNAPRPWPS